MHLFIYSQRLWLLLCQTVNIVERTTVFRKLFRILELSKHSQPLANCRSFPIIANKTGYWSGFPLIFVKYSWYSPQMSKKPASISILFPTIAKVRQSARAFYLPFITPSAPWYCKIIFSRAFVKSPCQETLSRDPGLLNENRIKPYPNNMFMI